MAFEIETESDFEFSRYTTFGVGGKCLKAFFPKSIEEAKYIFGELKAARSRFVVLGRGSNVLASDRFFDGYVISTLRLKGIEREGDTITSLAGTNVSELLEYCTLHGLGGLEFLAGIPATMGGIVAMNAGAGQKFICERLTKCAVFDGELHNFENKMCGFTYKHSTMRDINCIILSSTFRIEQSTPECVANRIAQYRCARRNQPLKRSCGCVFKNPEGKSAGKIIDECGLKGTKVGGAEVSRMHANFIVSDGARAADIYALIKYVKEKVFERSGIPLEEEVVYIGEFDDSDC